MNRLLVLRYYGFRPGPRFLWASFFLNVMKLNGLSLLIVYVKISFSNHGFSFKGILKFVFVIVFFLWKH
jgi:hypothetical protein